MRYGLLRAADFFASCARDSPGRTAAAPNTASLLKNPRRGEEQPQSTPGTLLFCEADIVHLPCEFAAVSYHGDRGDLAAEDA